MHFLRGFDSNNHKNINSQFTFKVIIKQKRIQVRFILGFLN